jgi:hypothetical protein
MADLQVLGTVTSAAIDAQGRLVVVGVVTVTEAAEWFVRRYVLP